MYTTIKLIHITSAALSFIGFFIRGILMLKDSGLLNTKLVKISPHIIDTILLITAISLAILSSQYPLTQSWLSAKVLGLLIYIGLGLFAFRFAKTKSKKATAWVLALLVYILIILTAVYKPF